MLRDVVAGSGLAIFAEVGLLIFFVTFVAVVWVVTTRSSRHYNRLAQLPLEDSDKDATALPKEPSERLQ